MTKNLCLRAAIRVDGSGNPKVYTIRLNAISLSPVRIIFLSKRTTQKSRDLMIASDSLQISLVLHLVGLGVHEHNLRTILTFFQVTPLVFHKATIQTLAMGCRRNELLYDRLSTPSDHFCNHFITLQSLL
jgi:hypothetical protein